MTAALPTGRAGRVLALGLALLLLALLWSAAVQPLLGWYSSRAETLSAQGALLSRRAALAAELPALEAATRRLRQAAPTRHAFLAGATDAIAGAALEQMLQTMASRGGVTLSSAEALAPQPDGPYQRIALRVSMATDWTTLIGLLRSITTSQPTMLVDDLQLSDNGETAEAPPISASFTVIAFRDGNAPPAAPVEGAAP